MGQAGHLQNFEVKTLSNKKQGIAASDSQVHGIPFSTSLTVCISYIYMRTYISFKYLLKSPDPQELQPKKNGFLGMLSLSAIAVVFR